MKTAEMVHNIKDGAFDGVFEMLYGPSGDKNTLARRRARYAGLAESFLALYGNRGAHLFSVPGRSEISGNHTDHNQGKVLAAALDVDMIAVAAPSDEPLIKIKSDGYRESVIKLNDTGLDPKSARKGNSSALVAGVAAYFAQNGRKIGGFEAYTKSDVGMGSGMSSSAAFEVMVGNILSHLYNGGAVPPIELAKAGKYAENVFFGKPCGLMDQTACAVGGFCYMDFADPENPFVEKLAFDLSKQNYSLCLIHTGGSHAKLTGEYAAIPRDMKSIASHYGKAVLRTVDKRAFWRDIPALRKKAGDRALLRAFHYFEENDRVEAQREALKKNDCEGFLFHVTQSGNSSFKYLQNVYCHKNADEQGLSVALALCEKLGAACRVHGGGFAGTALAFVKDGDKTEFKKTMDGVFGEGACQFMHVRPHGAVMVRGDGLFPNTLV